MSIGSSFVNNGRESRENAGSEFGFLGAGKYSGFVARANSPLAMNVLVGQETSVPDCLVIQNGRFMAKVVSISTNTVTIAAAPTSNSRIDAIVAYVDFTATGNGTTQDNPGSAVLLVVQGTVSASPTAPTNANIISALPAVANGAYVRIANVTVGTNVTTISNANISNTSVVAITGSKLASYNIPFQRDTTNTTETSASIQSGWGRLASANVSSITDTITFPTPYTSLPVVVATPGGAVLSGSGTAAYPGTGAAYTDNMQVVVNQVTNTNCVVTVSRQGGQTFTAGHTLFYTWVAVGV